MSRDVDLESRSLAQLMAGRDGLCAIAKHRLHIESVEVAMMGEVRLPIYTSSSDSLSLSQLDGVGRGPGKIPLGRMRLQ